MKTNTTKNSLLILIIGVLAAVSLFVWQKIQAVIGKGLTDSQKIRVSEANTCIEQSESPQFSGCNSIL